MSTFSNWRWMLATGILAVSLYGFPLRAQDETKPGGGAARVETKVQVDGDKIVIIDGDGVRREVDIAGARSVMIQRGKNIIVRDGQQEQQVFGKAIVVGPDGETMEVDLTDAQDGVAGGADNFLFKFRPLNIVGDGGENIVIRALTPGNKYYIGVTCQPVDEELAVHMGLSAHVGLVVKSVSPESPAARGGLEVDDIILNADDKELTTPDDLAQAVNQAGEAGRELSLSIVRDGKDVRITLKPEERKGMRVLNKLEGWQPFENLQLEGIGPGIIQWDNSKLDGLSEELAERMKNFELANVQALEEWKQRTAEMRERFQEELQNFQRDNPHWLKLQGELEALQSGQLQDRIRELTEKLDAARSEIQTLREKMKELVREQVEQELNSRRDK